MKYFLILVILSFHYNSLCQNGAVENYSLGENDIVVFPFGMNNVIKVGTIDAGGNVILNWTDLELSKYSDTEMYFGDYGNAFNMYCDEETVEKGTKNAVKVALAGDLFIWNGKMWVGALIATSSSELKTHLLDEYGKDAVTGEYVKWVYADGDTEFKSSCKSTANYGDQVAVYLREYNLSLKKGWNMVKYQIIETGTIPDAAAYASKVLISTPKKTPKSIKWFLKSF